MLQRIHQVHYDGCFVACVAMLLQVSYEEAFSRLFPKRYMPLPEEYGMVGRLVDESLDLLPRVGLRLQRANLRSVRSLRKRTSLVILRWKHEPTLSHGVVFDGEQGKFLDPCYVNPLTHRCYNENLETIYYVKRIQNGIPIQNANVRRSQSPGGLPHGGSLPSSSATTGTAGVE